MAAIIKQYPVTRESVERWMVEHITQKNVYKAWKTTKQKNVKEFIKLQRLDIVHNLKLIFEEQGILEFPVVNRLGRNIRRFASEQSLKASDVYDDVRKWTLEKYKNKKQQILNMELQENDEIEPRTQSNDPYYQYKSVFKAEKFVYIG
eukprot:491314_1